MLRSTKFSSSLPEIVNLKLFIQSDTLDFALFSHWISMTVLLWHQMNSHPQKPLAAFSRHPRAAAIRQLPAAASCKDNTVEFYPPERRNPLIFPQTRLCLLLKLKVIFKKYFIDIIKRVRYFSQQQVSHY